MGKLSPAHLALLRHTVYVDLRKVNSLSRCRVQVSKQVLAFPFRLKGKLLLATAAASCIWGSSPWSFSLEGLYPDALSDCQTHLPGESGGAVPSSPC